MSLSKEEIITYFGIPLKEAINKLGVGETNFKKLCRRHKIKRWPYKKWNAICNSNLYDIEKEILLTELIRNPNMKINGNFRYASHKHIVKYSAKILLSFNN